jgi:hypothetical protein
LIWLLWMTWCPSWMELRYFFPLNLIKRESLNIWSLYIDHYCQNQIVIKRESLFFFVLLIGQKIIRFTNLYKFCKWPLTW